METMRKAPRLTNEGDEGLETLDADLWGQLQEYLPLHRIYEKLSQWDLFRLRLVSKEWNRAALQWILPKPSFVTIARCLDPNRLLNGIVTYDRGKFKFYRQRMRLCHVQTHVLPFEVEGLILCHSANDLEKRGVYNVHNQTWHAIPAGPEQSETWTMSTCGLLVDTTVRPYTFKLVEGNQNFRTQIYDSKSRSWSRTSSYLSSSTTKLERKLNTVAYSCICHKGSVYMSVRRHTILKYSMEDDKWTELRFPKATNGVDKFLHESTLGVWEGRIFTTLEHHKMQRVSVWELVDDSEGQEWVEYARMPKEQYEWLWKHEFDGLETCMRTFFRDGHLLVCSWWWDFKCVDALALFNIATKDWQNVDIPRGTVAIDERGIESSHDSQAFDEAVNVCPRVYDPNYVHEYDDDEGEDTDEEDEFDEDEDIDEEDDFDDGVDD